MLGKLEEDLVLSVGRQRNGQVLSNEEYQLLRGGLPSRVSRSENAGEHRNCLPHTREPQPWSSKGSRTGGPVPWGLCVAPEHAYLPCSVAPSLMYHPEGPPPTLSSDPRALLCVDS